MKYIDTSAFVKYYSSDDSEKGAEKVKELIDGAKNGEEKLISSILLIGESVSVFDKWVRMKLLTKQDFLKVLSAFLSDIGVLVGIGSLIFEEITSFTAMGSVDFIIKYNLSTNDALHLYSSVLNKTEVECFVCSDNKLLLAAQSEGLTVWNPED